MTFDPPDAAPPIVKIRAAARMLRMNPERLRTWVDRGTIAPGQPGGAHTIRYLTIPAFRELAEMLRAPIDWQVLDDTSGL